MTFSRFCHFDKQIKCLFLSRQSFISKLQLGRLISVQVLPCRSLQTNQPADAEALEFDKNAIYLRHPWRDQITILEDTLKIDRSIAIKILKRHPEILSCDREHVTNRLDELQKRSIRRYRVVDMPWLLYLSDDKLNKIASIVGRGLGLKFEVAVAFGQFRTQRVRELVIAWKMDDRAVLKQLGSSYKHRIQYLAASLECHPVNVADMIAKMRRIATLPFSRIHHLTQKLLNHGISASSLVNDPYVIVCVPDAIEKRLKVLKQHRIRNVKPWLLRQRWSLFMSQLENGTADVYMPKAEEEDEDESDLNQYEKLFRKLYHVSIEEARELTTKGPKLVMLPDTLQKRLSTLKSKGYSFQDILEAPRILLRSSYVIEKRYEEVQSTGVPKPPLKLLQQHTPTYNSQKERINSSAT